MGRRREGEGGVGKNWAIVGVGGRYIRPRREAESDELSCFIYSNSCILFYS